MAKYIITGGKKLNGTVRISGSKNSILPCLAASLLTDEEITLTNVPQISDVEVIKEILKHVGSTVEEGDHTLKIMTKKVENTTLPSEMTSRLRGSILLAGALLSRAGKTKLDHPGGDVIGKRSLGVHWEGFEKLGYKIEIEDLTYTIHRSWTTPKDVEIFLFEPSVTATENLILGSVLREGKTTLKNCAMEPHIVDLCRMIVKMGGDLKGIGSMTLEINGVKKLNGCEFRISSDSIEMGTYAVASAITNGSITIENCYGFEFEPIINILSRMGVKIEVRGEEIKVSSDSLRAIPVLKTNIWPGFPTDLMSPIVILATQAKGVSLLHDWMYESRFFFVDKLINMGAQITIADPHRILVNGPTPLIARNLESPDIRAGMALVLASLVAKGVSIINRAELIERGYEDVVGNLSRLGASISREE